MNTIRLYNIAFYQVVFLVIYNIAEGVLSSYFGFKEESLTLFGFGIDSFIEVVSGQGILHMITRIRLNPESNRSTYERTALRITGTAFYLLVAGLVITSAYNIITGQKPESTFFGVIISSTSIVVMGLFVIYQTKVGILELRRCYQ
jgi:divalent metal cation (Fe/Co/Zn/Cd) transporter